MKSLLDSRGYLLGEITITVSVVALILLLIVPNFMKNSKKTKENLCYANQKQIEVAMVRYAIDEGVPTGAPIGVSDFVPFYINKLPFCPSKGKYKIKKIGKSPICTVHGE